MWINNRNVTKFFVNNWLPKHMNATGYRIKCIGVFVFTRRCADWAAFDIKVTRELFNTSTYDSLSRYVNVIGDQPAQSRVKWKPSTG